MRSLLKVAIDMEVKLHALLAELQELKNKARELEEENLMLRQGLADTCREKCVIGRGQEGTSHTGAGFLNLLELYDKGYHVCNLHFGLRRKTECLFCVSFLRREYEPSAQSAEDKMR